MRGRPSMPEIADDHADYHAHVYFAAKTRDLAVELCRRASRKFGLKIGRVHQRCVGPHPQWSCQLTFGPEDFGVVIPWLALNRGPLTIFVHPNTGDGYLDHTDHVMWLGPSDELNLTSMRASRRASGRPRERQSARRKS